MPSLTRQRLDRQHMDGRASHARRTIISLRLRWGRMTPAERRDAQRQMRRAYRTLDAIKGVVRQK